MLFAAHADLMNIGSNDGLTIRSGIFNEFVPVEMHEDVQNNDGLIIRIGIFNEFVSVKMHEDIYKQNLTMIFPNDFGKIIVKF